MNDKNRVENIVFSGAFITAQVVHHAENYAITNRTILVNPTMAPVIIAADPNKYIPPKCSIILENVSVIQAEMLILLEVKERRNIGNIIFEQEWHLLEDISPKIQLWKSPQDAVGTLRFDPRSCTGETASEGEKEEYTVKVNLWFSPEKTDCLIHNNHDFIEIHTQAVGLGRMQKFKQDDYSTLYWDELMAEGYTTPVPYCKCSSDNTSQFEYPWHQYYADSDCIWMAIEYHPIS